MVVTMNPFDAGGYSLAEMTEAINILPNVYTRLGQMGLFRFEGVTQRSVIIEQAEGVLNLLPTVPLGGPATVANRDTRSMRSFTVPWIPHDDVITPQDIQGVRGFGVADAADPLATTMERKLTRMRVKHAQTREYMEVNALRGIVKDGAGSTLYDYFSEFGLARIEVDFVLGTAGTQVQAKVRDVLRQVETELKGETMSGVLALVSPEFFDKLIGDFFGFTAGVSSTSGSAGWFRPVSVECTVWIRPGRSLSGTGLFETCAVTISEVSCSRSSRSMGWSSIGSFSLGWFGPGG